MTLMIMGAIMIFLSTLLGVFLLVLSMPIIFNFITNEIWLEKLFLRFGKENFSFALIKLKNDLMSNLVIYVFFGILIALFFVLVTIVISQIRHRKNHKVAIRLFYTNFALTGIIFTILVLMIIFTGIWWFSFILAVLAMGLFFLQNSFLSLIKNSINHKEYQIGNIITAGDGKISNENYLDINNEIVNIRKNSIQAQQSLSLVKEQLQSEFLNDKDYETNEIDNNKLVVKSKASLPDILNPMLLKENKDDGDAIRKIIAEPIYQKDSKNNVISSDEQKEADGKNQVDINNEYLQVKQPEECSYVAPSELEYDDGKQPLMSNSSQTGSREDDFVKQSFANGYYQGQQYSQVQEQIVPLGEQKEADGKNQVDINNEYLQVKQPEECSYVAPSELEYDDGKQPLMSNSSQTGSREDDFVKQSFANGYYQGQQYSQVQEQIVPLGEQKEADGKNQVDINNEYLQVKQPEECSYVAPSELEYDDGKQPLMSNSSQTGSREDDFVKQSFANEYYQGQQYSQVQEQIVPLGEQKEADGKNQVDINNEYLQVKQPEECSYVAPSELEYDDGKQPLMSNSSQTGSREDDFVKQSFANGYYQGQQYSQVQEQIVPLGEQKEADGKNQVDINNEYLQVKQPEECSYVAPSELEYDDGKQPLMSNSSQTGSREDDFVKQSFANGYYQGQQYSQVQEQIVPLGEQKEADGKNQVDINNEYLQVKQPEECSYVAPSELEYDDGKQPLMSNSSQTGSREDDFVKQSFANGYYQGQQYSQVQEQIVPLGEQKEADDTDIEPNKIYCHSSMTGKTVEIVPQKTRKFLFANLPGKPDELESPVYEYNPIEEQDKKTKQDKKKNHESRSYGIFDQTMQRRVNPVGIQEAVSYPQGYVQARYQTKSNYYEQPTLNINLPNQETYNKSVVNQQFDVAAIAEHYHSQYPNYIFTNDSCPICYQGG